MSEPFIGQIIMFGGNFAIQGYAYCHGQTLSISQNTALFSLLGTTYGGNGQTTFALPDLRGRIAMQQGTGPGLPPVALGQRGGAVSHTLTQQQMPSHSHGVSMPCDSEEGNTDDPSGKFPAVNQADQYSNMSNDQMATFNSGSVGNNQSFSIQNPFLGINFLIALTGIYPSQ